MKRWLRRIRGAIGMGLTWAMGWAPIGAITGWVAGVVVGFPLSEVAANYAAMFGAMGFIGGTIFSGVLGIAEGRHRFDQLALPRFIAWGALGGLLLGGLGAAVGLLGAGFTTLGSVVIGAATLLGAGSAAGTLLLARAGNGHAALTDGDDRGPAHLSGHDSSLIGKAE